jgi:hypothetical protein
MAMEWIEENEHLQHHIDDVRLRPWPIIYFKNGSIYECRTSGTDARFIRGTEYDEIDFDEAALDYEGAIVNILRGRLRGTRPDGVSRIARLNVCTSPGDAPWLRERYDKGSKDNPEANRSKYLSFKLRTRDNIHLTEEQIQAMEAQYTDEMRAVEMDAEFPDYGLSFFPKSHLAACTDTTLNDTVYLALNPEDGTKPRRGYNLEEHPRHGVTKYEAPYIPDRRYILRVTLERTTLQSEMQAVLV